MKKTLLIVALSVTSVMTVYPGSNNPRPLPPMPPLPRLVRQDAVAVVRSVDPTPSPVHASESKTSSSRASHLSATRLVPSPQSQKPE